MKEEKGQIHQEGQMNERKGEEGEEGEEGRGGDRKGQEGTGRERITLLLTRCWFLLGTSVCGSGTKERHRLFSHKSNSLM